MDLDPTEEQMWALAHVFTGAKSEDDTEEDFEAKVKEFFDKAKRAKKDVWNLVGKKGKGIKAAGITKAQKAGPSA